MRVWSCPSKPTSFAISRARCRATTTSCSWRIAMVRSGFGISRVCHVLHDNDCYVVPAAVVVAIENPGNQAGMLARKSRIVCARPVGRQPVAMQDQESARRETEIEFLSPPHDMSKSPAVRDQLTPLVRPFHPANYITYTGKAALPFRGRNPGRGPGGA